MCVYLYLYLYLYLYIFIFIYVVVYVRQIIMFLAQPLCSERSLRSSGPQPEDHVHKSRHGVGYKKLASVATTGEQLDDWARCLGKPGGQMGFIHIIYIYLNVYRQIYRQIGRQIDMSILTDRQIDRQIDIYICIYMYICICIYVCLCIYIYGQIDRQIERERVR